MPPTVFFVCPCIVFVEEQHHLLYRSSIGLNLLIASLMSFNMFFCPLYFSDPEALSDLDLVLAQELFAGGVCFQSQNVVWG